VKKLKVGDPMDESQRPLGPLIRESDAIRPPLDSRKAVRGGARLLCVGNRKGSLSGAGQFSPYEAGHEGKLSYEIVLRPSVTVEPYHDFAAALKRSQFSPNVFRGGGLFHAPTPSYFFRPMTNWKWAD